jgi:hypothetical protein
MGKICAFFLSTLLLVSVFPKNSEAGCIHSQKGKGYFTKALIAGVLADAVKMSRNEASSSEPVQSFIVQKNGMSQVKACNIPEEKKGFYLSWQKDLGDSQFYSNSPNWVCDSVYATIEEIAEKYEQKESIVRIEYLYGKACYQNKCMWLVCEYRK